MTGFDTEKLDGESDAFRCPKCGGRVVLAHTLPTRVTGVGSIDFRCLGCGDWIDVVVDKAHIYKPVREFESYAIGVAREYFDKRAQTGGGE